LKIKEITLIEWPEKIIKKIDNKIDLFFEYENDLKKDFKIKGLNNKN
jgi:tRNA A37 threonylcarbamoyladenosine biosynthesis protein TsaE